MLRIVERRAQISSRPDGSYLLTGEGRTRDSVAKLSPRDAIASMRSRRSWRPLPTCCGNCVARAPNIVEGFGIGAIRESVNALGTAGILKKLSLDQQRSLLDLFTCSPARCSTNASRATSSRRCSASTPSSQLRQPLCGGSAYVMLHHAFAR